MAEKLDRIHWERDRDTWTSPVGTVRRDGSIWTANVYRNQRAGSAFTITKTGFESANSAASWVESNCEN